MAFDSNRAASEAAERSRQIAQKNMADLAGRSTRPPGGAAGKQGGLLGFVIVVALIAIVAFWIASMQ